MPTSNMMRPTQRATPTMIAIEIPETHGLYIIRYDGTCCEARLMEQIIH